MYHDFQYTFLTQILPDMEVSRYFCNVHCNISVGPTILCDIKYSARRAFSSKREEAITDIIVSYLSLAYYSGVRHTVAQLVEGLRYKPEGRRFDWNFSLA